MLFQAGFASKQGSVFRKSPDYSTLRADRQPDECPRSRALPWNALLSRLRGSASRLLSGCELRRQKPPMLAFLGGAWGRV
jgi:hypothetical protein